MAKAAKGITAVAITNMKRPKKGRAARLYDGHGLFFFRGVHKDVWKLRYKDSAGKEKWRTLGAFPAMSLKDAREAAETARTALANGGSLDKNATFEEVARRWFSHKGRQWAGKTQVTCMHWLTTDVFPHIGGKCLDEIQPQEILDLLRTVEAEGHLYKLRRLYSYIKRIFSFGISNGLATRNPAGDLIIADLFEPEQRKNHPAFTTPEQAAYLMRLIWSYEGRVARASLLMLALTLSRPGEVRAMRWEDIDTERRQWRYTVTKTNTLHAVPLCRQAMTLLDDMRLLSDGGAYVFPGNKPGRPQSNNTLNNALRAMGIDTKTQHTSHGFRAMGRTLLAEMGYKPEAIERQLSHKQPNDTVAAYARETLLNERAEMMQEWADYLDALRDGATVTPIRKAG